MNNGYGHAKRTTERHERRNPSMHDLIGTTSPERSSAWYLPRAWGEGGVAARGHVRGRGVRSVYAARAWMHGTCARARARGVERGRTLRGVT